MVICRWVQLTELHWSFLCTLTVCFAIPCHTSNTLLYHVLGDLHCSCHVLCEVFLQCSVQSSWTPKTLIYVQPVCTNLTCTDTTFNAIHSNFATPKISLQIWNSMQPDLFIQWNGLVVCGLGSVWCPMYNVYLIQSVHSVFLQQCRVQSSCLWVSNWGGWQPSLHTINHKLPSLKQYLYKYNTNIWFQ